MRAILLCFALPLLAWLATPSRAAETPAADPATTAAEPDAYKMDAGPHEVEELTLDWRDERRMRDVPVKIYLPKDAGRPSPVILFSHGLGGSREGYSYLGRHWASHGYASVHLQHIGSDDRVWRDEPAENRMPAMRRAAGNLAAAVNRPLDVRFALDTLTRENAEGGALAGRLDLDRVGMAGHSFGAFTTLAVVGQAFSTTNRGMNMTDDRIKAAIPMSAPVRGERTSEELDTMFGSIKVPCLHMTGTLDDSPLADTKAADRRLPFDHSTAAGTYLIVFEGGDHMIFSGRPRVGFMSGDGSKDAEFQKHIRASSTAFWDAYLLKDEAARAWLADGDFKAMLGEAGTFESK